MTNGGEKSKKHAKSTMSDRTPSPSPTENALTSPEDIETAKWTRYLPEAFGIRQSVQSSKYRWCAKESAMWAITTGTAMSLHRFRMRSTTSFAINMGFGSFMVVYCGSYYFCVKRRDYREKMIELMMKLNSFEHALNMPEPTPVDENHPFVEPAEEGIPAERQYVANLPERKEWQSQLPPQDPKEVFQEVKKKK